MSKIEKPRNIFKQTLEFAATLWIQKPRWFLKGRVGRYRKGGAKAYKGGRLKRPTKGGRPTSKLS